MAHRKGYDAARSIMLDASTFTVDHVSAKGAIQSGTALAETVTPGLYKPHELGVDPFAGLLLTTTAVGDGTGTDLATANNIAVAMVWEGIIDETYLPVPENSETDGTVDAAAKASAAGVNFRWEAS